MHFASGDAFASSDCEPAVPTITLPHPLIRRADEALFQCQGIDKQLSRMAGLL